MRHSTRVLLALLLLTSPPAALTLRATGDVMLGTAATLERKGLKLALIAFHPSAATNDVNDLPAAKALVKDAASKHDIVIVSFHGGAEGPKADHVMQGRELYLGENRGDLRAFT